MISSLLLHNFNLLAYQWSLEQARILLYLPHGVIRIPGPTDNRSSTVRTNILQYALQLVGCWFRLLDIKIELDAFWCALY